MAHTPEPPRPRRGSGLEGDHEPVRPRQGISWVPIVLLVAALIAIVVIFLGTRSGPNYVEEEGNPPDPMPTAEATTS